MERLTFEGDFCDIRATMGFCHRHIHTIFAATETGGLTILHWKRKPRRSLTDAAPPAVHLWIASKRQTISFARIARNG